LIRRLLYDIPSVVTISPTLDILILFLAGSANILLFSMMPRFIIGVRELYHHDCHRRWQGVDTGFGVFSQPTAGRSAVLSAIAFAPNVAPGESQTVEGEANDSDAIQLEVLGDNTRQA
jgi:hypothetical protein